MFWFGGFGGPQRTTRIPLGGHNVWPDVNGCWTVGPRAVHEVRTASVGGRHVMLVGPCGISRSEHERLAARGVPDEVAWQWPGSYTVVEVTADGTTVWTDLGGAQPIYTLKADGGTMWASSSRALAGLTGQRVDWDTIVARLLAPRIPPLIATRSTFADVELVPAGHRLALSSDGQCRTKRVWVPQPCLYGDPAASLRTELATAVAVRMDGAATPTADLSGGYDSTALCLLAAEQLRPEACIVGTTVHPEGITSGGDMDYARIAARHPGIDHQLLPLTPVHAPYSALDKALPATDEPAPSTVAQSRFRAQMRWLRSEFGSDCHMTGDGGDGLLCTPPLFLADLARTLSLPRLVQETVAWARLRRAAPWTMLRGAIRAAATDRSRALRKVEQALFSAGGAVARFDTADGGVAWFPSSPIPAWGTPKSQKALAAMFQTATGHPVSQAGDDIAMCSMAEAMAAVGRTAHADDQLAEFDGISLHNPFTDSRLIDMYISVPLTQRPGPADYKPILRQALGDLLPPALAARTTKGDFNADHYRGMRAAMPVLLDLADGHLAGQGLLDPRQLRKSLVLAAAGMPLQAVAIEPVIATEAWLRALNGAPAVQWASSDSLRGTP